MDLNDLMNQLGAMGIDSILLEGGATLNDAALRAGIVQEVVTYIAPKMIGGAAAPTPVGGMGVEHLQDAYQLGQKMCIRDRFLCCTVIQFKDVYGNTIVIDKRFVTNDAFIFYRFGSYFL